MAGLGLIEGGPLVETPPSITIVQSTSGHNPNTTTSGPWTVTATLAHTPTAGNYLVAVFGNGTSGSAMSGSTLTWTWVQGNDLDVASTAIGRAVSDGSTTAFTFTVATHGGNASTDLWVWLAEVSALQGGADASEISTSLCGDTGTATTTMSWALTATKIIPELVIVAVSAYGGNSDPEPNTPVFTGSCAQEFVGNTLSTATNKLALFVGMQVTSGEETPSGSIEWSQTGGSSYGGVALSLLGFGVPAPSPQVPMPGAVNRGGTY